MRFFDLVFMVAALGIIPSVAHSQVSDGIVKIAVLNDQSGPYADNSGKGSVEAVRMAIEEFGETVLGKPIQLIDGDHQNKPDVGAAIVNKWIDQDQVDAVVDVPTSSVALAVQEIMKRRSRVLLISGAGAPQLTGTNCSPTGFQWTYDTYALAHGIGSPGVKTLGDTWFFITVDYAFGLALEKDISDVVKSEGGKIVGSVRHPLNTSDFASFLLQAQSSEANVIVFANASQDFVNSVKQAHEFGLTQSGKKLVAAVMFPGDIHAIGLESTQGFLMVDAYNVEQDDASRAWAKTYLKRTGRMPSMAQAGSYSSVLHYLKAIKAAGTDEANAVARKMREIPVNDMLVRNGKVRGDGRMVHDMYLMQVKTPQESNGAWDYLKLIATLPGDEITRPLNEGGCPLIK